MTESEADLLRRAREAFKAAATRVAAANHVDDGRPIRPAAATAEPAPTNGAATDLDETDELLDWLCGETALFEAQQAMVARELEPAAATAAPTTTVRSGLAIGERGPAPAAVVPAPSAPHLAAPTTSAMAVGDILLDSLAQAADAVGVFAWPGGTAMWANGSLARCGPARSAFSWTLMELLDEWSQAHFLVRVLPTLLRDGRWRGQLNFVDGPGVTTPMATTLIAHRHAFGEIDSFTLLAHELDAGALELSSLPAPEALARGPLAALIQHITDLLLLVDPSGIITYASPAAISLLDLDAMEGGGVPPSGLLQLIHVDDRPANVDELESMPRRLRLRAGDGTWRHLETVVTDLRQNSMIGGYVLTAQDVTESVEAQRRVVEQAYTDQLTGLPNRVRLLDRLDVLIDEPDEGRPLALLLLDLDHLKRANDLHGTARIDRVLTALAGRLVETLDDLGVEDGLVARLRSDEFAVLVPDLTDHEQAPVIADELRDAVAVPVVVDGTSIEVTASVGIAFRGVDEPLEAMLADADRAARRAKDAGRNRTVVYDGDAARRDQRLRTFDHQLRQALASDGLLIRYQPIVAFESDTMVGAEALLRVRGEHGELLNPGAFVDAAESTGLIARLGGEVLRTTCRQLRQNDLDLSVNVSPRQVSAPGFADDVAEILESSGLDPARLWLEITEGAILPRSDRTEANILALRERGVRVGLDEMGSGHTSIGALRRFPLDFVKLDRSLVAGLGANYVDGAIVRSTIELAHQLGLVVIAVGVETDGQLDRLRQLGCDRAQGHLFSGALDVEQLDEHRRG